MKGTLTPFFATYANILTSQRSIVGHPCDFSALRMLPYRFYLAIKTLNFGALFEPRYIFGAGKLDQ